MNRPTLFIADLHLSDDTPDLNALFYRFLHDWQNRAAALYILGDFFDAWTGDDDDSETARQTASALKTFAQGCPVYFIAGNRDFLLGRHYAAQAGLTLLPERHLIDLYGQTALLTHGDELCTGDTAYLRYRRIIRHPLTRRLLLSLPAGQRKRIAAKLRQASRSRQSGAHYTPADVSDAGIAAALQAFPAAELIIHGHTHRPAVYGHTRNGKTLYRYVLPDWHNGRGGYLLADASGLTLHSLPEEPEN